MDTKPFDKMKETNCSETEHRWSNTERSESNEKSLSTHRFSGSESELRKAFEPGGTINAFIERQKGNPYKLELPAQFHEMPTHETRGLINRVAATGGRFEIVESNAKTFVESKNLSPESKCDNREKDSTPAPEKACENQGERGEPMECGFEKEIEGRAPLKDAYEKELAPKGPGVYTLRIGEMIMKVGKAQDGLRKRASDYYRGLEGGTAGLKHITKDNRDRVTIEWKECAKETARQKEIQWHDEAKKYGHDLPWSSRR